MYEQSCRGKSSFHVEFGVSPLYSTMSGMCEELVVVAAVVAAVVVVVVFVAAASVFDSLKNQFVLFLMMKIGDKVCL